MMRLTRFHCWTVSLLAISVLMPARAIEPTLRIRFNTVGYLPHAQKKVTIAAPCAKFVVTRVADGAKVFWGNVTGPVSNPDTKEQLYTADVSALTHPGEYQLDVPGVGRSATFRIGADVYREPFYLAMRGMYLWRCGTAVIATYHGETFAHGPCHTNDAWMDYVGGGHSQKDGTQGWHDAGDYNKYVVNAGAAVGVLFRAWEDFGPKIRSIRLDIPESGGPMPDFLAEVKWEMDWLLKMQAPDGSVYHKVSTRKFGAFILPDAETEERYFTPWGSEATADFVAMTAQAARIYQPFDPEFAARCLEAAWKGYRFLEAHPGYHKPDQTGFSTGAYEAQSEPGFIGVPHNRLWAAAELWETTGSKDVLHGLEKQIREVHGRIDDNFDWQDLKNLGLLTYVLSERPNRNEALVRLVRRNLLAVADRLVRNRNRHGYARPMGSRYFWGCNGGVARQAVLLMAADRIAGRVPLPHAERGAERLMQRPPPPPRKTEYRAVCSDALNYLFGRNCYGRSFVTGLGFKPPMHPHDRRSGGDNVEDPWPGYLVGGPNPQATDWKDVQADFRTNEIAINWNAALIYALAAVLEP
jgi:endoglucanase